METGNRLLCNRRAALPVAGQAQGLGTKVFAIRGTTAKPKR